MNDMMPEAVFRHFETVVTNFVFRPFYPDPLEIILIDSSNGK